MTDQHPERATDVHGPIFYPGLGYEVRLYFATEEAAQGFAVFAANGWTAKQERHPPVLRWEPASGGEAVGPLPPDHILAIWSVHIGADDNTVTIEYSAVGIG